MLREFVVVGLLGCAAIWAAGLPDGSRSRLGDRTPEAAGTATGSHGARKQWSAKCEEIITRFEASMSGGDPQSLTQAIGQTAKQVAALREFENDLNAANCPVNARELNEATHEMSENAEPNPLDDPSL